SPATTSPVLTPIRAARDTPWSRSSSLLSATSASRISPPARTARRASSSWTFGTPKTAITASPMNFSTVPPCRSRAARISSKYRDITRRSDSGSSRSPIAVDPVTSQKTTVTVLRVSCCATGSASGAAHAGQNAKSSGLSRPQFAQVSIHRRVIGGRNPEQVSDGRIQLRVRPIGARSGPARLQDRGREGGRAPGEAGRPPGPVLRPILPLWGGIGVRSAEDVRVPEGRRTVLLRRRTRDGAAGDQRLPPRVDRRTVGVVPRVVPYRRPVRPGRGRVHVVAEELGRQRVGAAPSGVTGGTSMQLGERPRPRSADVRMLHDADQHVRARGV